MQELIFYTDGLLRRSLQEEGLDTTHIGIGWVQVDDKEEVVIDEGSVRARN